MADRPPLPPLPLATLPVEGPALTGRVVLLTGGSGGLGRALVERLLAEGAKVSTFSRRPVEVEGERAARLRSYQGDLARDYDFEGWVRDALAWGGRIDVLIHAAALVDGDTHANAALGVGRLLAVNAGAAHDLTALVVPAMRRRGHGRIVYVTSDLSMIPAPGYAMYAASKAALNSLAMSWSATLRASGILVNALHPGHIRTRLNPRAVDLPASAWPMVRYLVTCDADGPTGRFFGPTGELDWYRR